MRLILCSATVSWRAFTRSVLSSSVNSFEKESWLGNPLNACKQS
jgi:hypothetical protein